MQTGLYVEAEEYHIAVLHYIFFAFGTNQPLFFGCVHAAAGHEIIVIYHFGTDKASLKIAVDLARSLRCFRSYLMVQALDS